MPCRMLPATITLLNNKESATGTPHYSITAPRPPADANTWLLSVTDDRDAMVATDIHFAKP